MEGIDGEHFLSFRNIRLEKVKERFRMKLLWGCERLSERLIPRAHVEPVVSSCIDGFSYDDTLVIMVTLCGLLLLLQCCVLLCGSCLW